ncbi:MAG: undecaprenyl-diphosphate phosphatase [Candidatus Omnitrophica bacterium]|nr:undecaprenyl-diphosphate phosphatase [Candidatus Omnitrophota bacterium]
MIKYIILGIIQGLTEFLPVSSSGHLVVMQRVLGMSGEEIALTVILHLGTFFAVALFFFKDILKLLRDIKSLSLILLVTAITGVIGILGKDFFESLFTSPKLIAVSFLITGIILLFTRSFMEAKKNNVGLKDALILGVTQAIAIIPGISRSGMTISTLLFRRIEKETCFKFSFLVSLPVILGAALLEARKIDFAMQKDFLNLIVGFIFSLVTGLASLGILKLMIKRAKFYYFGYYCIVAAITTFLFIK